MKKSILIAALIFLLFLMAVPVILVLSLDREASEKPEKVSSDLENFSEETGFLLGTVIKIKLYGTRDDKIFEPVFREISRLESLFSLNIPTSDVVRINENSGQAPVPVSEETLDVVEKGLVYARLSRGAFDISIGPLVGLWRIGYDDARVPSREELDRALPLISWENVVLDRKEGTVFLTEPGMRMDLGGIAKGFIGDKIAEMLIARGFSRGIINLGGNVLVLGDKPDGSAYRIGVQNPQDSRGSYVGVIEVRGRSIVSSGTYERFFVEDEKRYHHILDPFEGYPVENSLEQVTIVSSLSVDGDGLSTAAFALGLKEGMALVESIPDVEAVFIDSRNHVYLSSGASSLFTLTNTDFFPAPL